MVPFQLILIGQPMMHKPWLWGVRLEVTREVKK
jgi:hypothetical protein